MRETEDELVCNVITDFERGRKTKSVINSAHGESISYCRVIRGDEQQGYAGRASNAWYCSPSRSLSESGRYEDVQIMLPRYFMGYAARVWNVRQEGNLEIRRCM